MSQLSPMSRRSFLQGMALAGAMSAMSFRPLDAAKSSTVGALAGSAEQAPLFPQAPLTPQLFALLPTGSIKASGWLLRQLQIQASGLGGHLDEFWPIVGPDSGW